MRRTASKHTSTSTIRSGLASPSTSLDSRSCACVAILMQAQFCGEGAPRFFRFLRRSSSSSSAFLKTVRRFCASRRHGALSLLKKSSRRLLEKASSPSPKCCATCAARAASATTIMQQAPCPRSASASKPSFGAADALRASGFSFTTTRLLAASNSASALVDCDHVDGFGRSRAARTHARVLSKHATPSSDATASSKSPSALNSAQSCRPACGKARQAAPRLTRLSAWSSSPKNASAF